ncbi:MAG: (2Fe-2S) ferredoxin domain-containing protein [Oscillospiraceae bacterium]|nr:(2Fe-2S) ferredoxin domain-containing protein [Oscillospiraceae bacterium]
MKIKSAAELNAFRENAKVKFAIKKGGIKIVVGMATCGMAAGAKSVMEALGEEIKAKKLDNVTLAQAGCIGLCEYEPIIEVFEPGKQKVTYAKVDANKAREIIDSHIIGGKTAIDYTIGAATANLK